MTVFGYIRVSTVEQAESGHGLDAQLAMILLAHPSAEVVSEQGSGGSLERPGLRELLDRLEPGDLLVVAKLDRLTRSVQDFLDLLRRSRADGWDFAALDFGLDTSTPVGELMAKILASFGEYERQVISQRTKDGLAAARAAGVQLGRPERVTPRQAERIMELYDVGLRLTDIARELTARGVRTPHGQSRWVVSTVSRVVRRELAKTEAA